MARRYKAAVAATAVVALGLTGCGSPSSNNGNKPDSGNGAITTQTSSIDAAAKGPAAAVPGAKNGGTLTVYSASTPNTFDPTDTYYSDSLAIGRLLYRTPTQFVVRDGKSVLVPDLTDVGSVSDDKLTWTFKMQPGIKYQDGSEVKVEDLAYAIKRSFARDLYPNGPAYQMQYFKGGDTYKGPYVAGGDKFDGVETQGTDTLVIHLTRAFADLPFFMTFPLFSPIPQAKDTKADYKNKPISTGPYEFDTYTPGVELKLKKNPNWDANTDAARHNYVDGYDFKWGGEDVKTQQQVLNSNGPDASALNYADVDSTLVPQVTGDKKAQLVSGESPCTYVWQMDTTKIPLEVRKAIAKAWPYDQTWKAAGVSDLIGQKASTFMPPGVPGYQAYPAVTDLSGTGTGDAAGAKALLAAAGKTGFEVSWYYDNTKPISQQVSQVRADALTAAGFKVKAIGVTTADLRTKISDYSAPVNMAQGPRGWCSDWPSGGSWLPVMFESHSVADQTSWGMQQDKTVDAQIDAVANMPADQAVSKWAGLDQAMMEKYLAIPFYYTKMGIVVGTNVGGAQGDPGAGMPAFYDIYLKS
ncbi:ABC transporter substrate-binding protein [Winogradskya consettensis]|uniref:ABC transporter n=1 Tax=Winogradskya consettensis TaxID=113560 RepID=A0A919VTN9_9ACTN|nr:ABC transporter substrate-binding protein [Actinoplanes consettensis]GIM75462.1 ABC transporter [Actinoplanes consettensis]